MEEINLGRVMGLTAFEIAQQEGFSGTKQEWLVSLVGEQGPQGIQGEKGEPGQDAPVEEISEQLDAIYKKVNEIYHKLSDDHVVYGVRWDKSSSPTLERVRDSANMTADIGLDDNIIFSNDFDNASIYREIQEVEDKYGNIFVRIPKFYIRKTLTDTQMTWEVSKTQHPGFYLPYCFWDFEREKELSYIDIGKYEASVGGGRLESKPGKFPQNRTSIVNFRNFAKANNDDESNGYQLLDIHTQDVITTLFYVEFATLNSRGVMAGFTSGRRSSADLILESAVETNTIVTGTAFGNGVEIGQNLGIGTSYDGSQIFESRTITDRVVDGDVVRITFDGAPVDVEEGSFVANRAWTTGSTDIVKATSGTIVDRENGRYPCKYRGIENPWGNIWKWVDGLNINDHQAWVTSDTRDYISSVFAHPYEPLSYINSQVNGFTHTMGMDNDKPHMQLPTVTTGASATTFFTDNYWQSAGVRAARVGGTWNSGSDAGLAAWVLDSSPSHAGVSVGARLLKKAL